MNSANSHSLAPQTRFAALACMDKIQAVTGLALRGCCSPLFAMADIVERLTRDPSTSRRISVVRASKHMSRGQEGMLASARPLRFAAQAGAVELPLIYMISSETSAELSALASESFQRGIFCNDIETLPSRWPKGAHPRYRCGCCRTANASRLTLRMLPKRGRSHCTPCTVCMSKAGRLLLHGLARRVQ